MTIRFDCPNCNELIAFADKHGGKRAHCASCGQKFIIPTEDKGKTKKIKPPKEISVPLGGFYRAVFVGSRRLFTEPKNTGRCLSAAGGFLRSRKILPAWYS
jgi:hypothetical protein